MEGMFARIKVVHNELDNLTFLQDERMGVWTVDHRFKSMFTCCESGVECWNVRTDPGDVVEESTAMIRNVMLEVDESY